MVANNASDFTAIKYAGVVSPAAGQLRQSPALFPGAPTIPFVFQPWKILLCLTLMKRSGPGDREQAKELLQQVVQNNLEGKQQAQQWLGKW